MAFWNRLRSADYTGSFYPLGVALFVFLIRIPFCLAGAGFDNDSYLFLVCAIGSRETGEYMPSRGPGYIVPDLIGQLLAPYGWQYLNLFSNAVQAASIPVFAAILRETNAPNRSVLLWLYALLPINIIGYSDVMVEYSLAILSILTGWLVLVRGHWVPATLLWGVGAAMRPSQGIFLLGVLLLVGWRLYGARRALIGALTASIPMLLLWVVPAYLLTGRWDILMSYLPYIFELRKWLIHLTIRLVAPIGVLPLLVTLLYLWKYRHAMFQVTRKQAPYLLSFGVILINIILFLRHPYKTNYLLLAIPFGIYWLGALPAVPVKFITSLAILQAFVSFPHSPPIGPHRIVGFGTLYTDFRERIAVRTEVLRLLETAPPKSVTLVVQRTIWITIYENYIISNKKYKYQFSNINRIYEEKKNFWFIAVIDSITLNKVLEWHELGYKVRVTDTIYRHFCARIQKDWIQKVERLPTSRGI